MIGIIDYKLGNLASVCNAFASLGFEAKIVSKVEEIVKCSHLVLPGVGSFEVGMKNLVDLGFDIGIKDFINSDKPFLGICLGMQLLFESSEEAKITTKGLGLIQGQVRSISTRTSLHVPHVGWNDVIVCEKKIDSLLKNGDSYYFVHSFYCECSNDEDSDAKVNYDFLFDVSVQKNKIYGVQFHPEKSHKSGLELLKRFGELKC